MRRKTAHVYVFDGRDGTVKVGNSIRPEARIKEVGRGANLVLAYKSDLLDDAEYIERAAHGILRLAKKHVKDEWFFASVAEARSAISTAIAIAEKMQLPLQYVAPPKWETLRVDDPDHMFRDGLDLLRKQEDDLPGRSEMVRRLVDRAAEALQARSKRK